MIAHDLAATIGTALILGGLLLIADAWLKLRDARQSAARMQSPTSFRTHGGGGDDATGPGNARAPHFPDEPFSPDTETAIAEALRLADLYACDPMDPEAVERIRVRVMDEVATRRERGHSLRWLS